MRRLRFLRRLVNTQALVVALLLATGGWLGSWSRIHSQPVDAGLQDFVVAHRSADAYLGPIAGTTADPRRFITIVAIDERTLAELGAYNGGYPRAYDAQLIEQLLAAPPRVIAFDMGFFEQTPDDDELATALDHARSLPVPTTVA